GPSGDVSNLTLAPHPHPNPTDLMRSLRPWIRLDAIHPVRGARGRAREFFKERKPFRLTAEGLLTRVYFDSSS
ncbi:MAG TPA: hypothetical protein VER38_05620, partial [Candidatus Eisenbacteria bacterium]|nr:hypothetical protein [Candidatus Eisenbacteria bacterium]